MSQQVTTLTTRMSESGSTTSAADVMSVVLGMGGFMLLVAGFIVPWVVALVQVIRRTDLKESKLLWIILLFVVGPLGVLMYAFMEDRKKLGYVSLAFYVAIPLLLVLFGFGALLLS